MQPESPAPEFRLDAPSPANVLRLWEAPVAPLLENGALAARSDSGGAADPVPADWSNVGGGAVGPDSGCAIQAGRYGLLVEAGSVDSLTDFTIATYDSTVLDVELGPHGRSFKKPVQLCVSYAGTAADPASPDYDGSQPQVVWYNDESGKWVPVPGIIDPQQLTISAKLSHFSRYAVQKASW